MPPRSNQQGLDFTPVLTHYLFLGTTILAVVGWFVAFIGQIVAQARGFGVGVVWFAIWLQLFLIVGVLYTLASDSVATHRFQISTFGAVAIVFAVLGVNEGIFTGVASLDAMAAGWLLLAIVDILWVLYFTSEEDSLALYIFNSMGNGGLSSPSRRRRTQSNMNVGGAGGGQMGMNGGYGNTYGGGGIGSDMAYDPKPQSQYSNGGIGSGSAGNIQRGPSMSGGSMTGAGMGGGMAAMNTGAGSMNNVPMGGGPGSIRSANNDAATNPSSPLMGGGAAMNPTSPSIEGGQTNGEDPTILYRAKALYAYTASPDDPNEISFQKGDILEVIDKQGKWWQARKSDGTIGIAPSNYLQII